MRKIVNVNFKKFLTSSFLLWVFISAIIPTCYAYEMSSVGVINLRNLYST
ncbi:exotoxin, partial [Pseudomonas aeruginosa]|nr:exotoxin [Pseudomonas aeruginosa]